MWTKIKSSLRALIRGMFSSFYGFLGAALSVLSLWLCMGLFTGTTNIQNYFRNRRELGNSDARIAALTEKLEATNRHIRLLQEHSKDFVSEMALQKLNLGDPALMILKK